MNADDYRFVRGFLREHMAYELGEGKEYLVESRLAPIAASYDLDDVGQLLARLRRGGDATFRQAILEAMAVHETSFFRGPRALAALKDVMVPALLRARPPGRKLRLWSAACATGQEPYSIALALLGGYPASGPWPFDILGTDLSEQAIHQARQGSYSQFEVQRGLPVQTLLKHFTKTGDRWELSPTLRGLVRFRKHNLLDSLLFLDPPFDVIFLRNVLIYFDPPAKTALFARLRQALAPDGYLILGDTESIVGLTNDFILPADSREYVIPARR
jgi:chemotaxis protein methyltransferase CheR